MKPTLLNDWQNIFNSQIQLPYFQTLQAFLKQEYQTQTIYPEQAKIFEAFNWCDFQSTKVVILGQDPYHNVNQAHGCSFSVRPDAKIPPSLKNIYQTLQNDLGIPPVTHGYLKEWATQGVLLLNTVLTVRAHEPNSHRNKGWETFTDYIIQQLSQKGHVVFILWGNPAKSKIKLIDSKKNAIITGVHPSPLSAYRGFFETKPFSETNQYLKQWQLTPIDWQLSKQIKKPD